MCGRHDLNASDRIVYVQYFTSFRANEVATDAMIAKLTNFQKSLLHFLPSARRCMLFFFMLGRLACRRMHRFASLRLVLSPAAYYRFHGFTERGALLRSFRRRERGVCLHRELFARPQELRSVSSTDKRPTARSPCWIPTAEAR